MKELALISVAWMLVNIDLDMLTDTPLSPVVIESKQVFDSVAQNESFNVGTLYDEDINLIWLDENIYLNTTQDKSTMGYQLSPQSLDRMKGVHGDLQDVIHLAIKITEVDFVVLEGLRSESRQRQLVDSGASQTMNSRHLTGHAVDLGAWVDGEVRWDWPLYYKIAEAVQEAAERLGVTVTWGGCWEDLNGLGDPESVMQDYVARKQAAGEKAFPDGPHFHLSWSEYQK